MRPGAFLDFHSDLRPHNLKVIGSNPIPATTFIITHLPFRSNHQDGFGFSEERTGRVAGVSSASRVSRLSQPTPSHIEEALELVALAFTTVVSIAAAFIVV
jgi:hypothetical protein